MSDFPSWCTPPQTLVGRDGAIFDALAGSGTEPVSFVGPAGVGTTAVGAAYVARLLASKRAARAVFIRMDGCTRPNDVVLELGRRLEADLPGDEIAVSEVLRHGPPTVVLLDDADLAEEATRHAVELGPHLLWVLTGRTCVVGQTIPLGPLTDAEMGQLVPPNIDPSNLGGLPLMVHLPAALVPGIPMSGVQAAVTYEDRMLLDLPMGTVVDRPSLSPFVVLRGRRGMPRRAVREALGMAPRPSPDSLKRWMREHGHYVHRLATDVSQSTSTAERRLLREASERVDDAALAALAAAACARLSLRFFQATDALDTLRRHLANAKLQDHARGLLHWLEGDAMLVLGDTEAANDAHRRSARLLRPNASRALVALALRCADRWAARGEADRAREWLARARAELANTPDPLALADTLRIAGTLAAQAGELVGAGALYDEANAILSRVDAGQRELANVLLGQAAIEIARGQLPDARDSLRLAEENAGFDVLLRAGIVYRRAEIALRRGKTDEASLALTIARRGFVLGGSMRGLLLCARLGGDIAAVAGHRLQASQAYRDAIGLCVRTRDLGGLRRVLRRALVVEQEGLPGPHIDELREHLDLVEVLLRVR